jgi:hypothetical protein
LHLNKLNNKIMEAFNQSLPPKSKRGAKRKSQENKKVQVHTSYPYPVLEKLGRKKISEIALKAVTHYFNQCTSN